MDGFEIGALILLGLTAWFWYDTIRAREIGVGAARAACQRVGVQLLDDTVALKRVRPARNDSGHLTLRRVYEFEFSGSGFDRQPGAVVLLGREVEMLDVASIVDLPESPDAH